MCPASFLVRSRIPAIATVVFDDFNRANGALNGDVANTGQTWQTLIAGGGTQDSYSQLIASNFLSGDGGGFESSINTGVTGDMSVEVPMIGLGIQGLKLFVACAVNASFNPRNNGYAVLIQSTGVRFLKSDVNLGALGPALTPVAGDVLRFDRVGTELKLFLNNTLFHSVIDTGTPPTGGSWCGIYVFGNSGGGADSFKVTRPSSSSVSFSDDFNRSDRELNGDNGWISVTSGLWAIAGGPATGRAQAVSINNTVDSYIVLRRPAQTLTKHDVSADLTALTGGGSAIFFAYAGSTDCYYARYLESSSTVEVRKFTGTRSVLGTYSVTNGSRVRIVHDFITGIIQVYLNNTLTDSITGHVLSSAERQVGIGAFTVGDRVDNFSTVIT